MGKELDSEIEIKSLGPVWYPLFAIIAFCAGIYCSENNITAIVHEIGHLYFSPGAVMTSWTTVRLGPGPQTDMVFFSGFLFEAFAIIFLMLFHKTLAFWFAGGWACSVYFMARASTDFQKMTPGVGYKWWNQLMLPLLGIFFCVAIIKIVRGIKDA
jgi:hypothetical protein